MAILNPNTGRVVQGAARSSCVVDGNITVAGYGGLAKWLDDDTVIYVTGNVLDPLDPNEVRVESTNLVTGKKEVLANHGAGVLEAGGSRWCGWLGDGITGLFGDIADSYAGLRGVGSDGTIAITPVYSDGLGCRLYATDGRITDGPREAMAGFRVLGPTSAMWTVDGEIRALNARVPVGQVGKVHRPKRVVIKEEEWIVYECGIGIVAHPYDSLLGYRLNAVGQVFYMDAIAWQNKIRIAYATDEFDSPAGLIITEIDVTAPRLQLPNVGSGGNFKNIADVEKRVFLTGGSTAAAAPLNPKSVITAQNGLLEDEIAYRLTLLATNILEPLKAQYPHILIKSGFRQGNSGVGQHELGEAVDIQIKNQDDALLYECASWMRDNLAFDQLILNYTKAGDGKPWIHVSFSPTSLRGEVLTKDYADQFHEGLGMIEDYTGEEAAAINRARSEVDKMILDSMTAIQARDSRGSKQTIVTDEVTDMTSEVVVNKPRPEYVDVIQRIADVMNPYIQGLTDEEKAFQILIRVVWQLRGEGVGLTVTPVNSRGVQLADDQEDFFINYRGERGNAGGWPGFNAGGYNLSGQWVGYSNGLLYQILGPRGVFVPQWTPAPRTANSSNIVTTSRWKAPIDPGDEFTTEWRSITIDPTKTS
jgi:hypothetical protein